jgi:hypothetical protein
MDALALASVADVELKMDPSDANIPFRDASAASSAATTGVVPPLPLCTARASALPATRSSFTSAFRYSTVFASVCGTTPDSYAAMVSACAPPAFNSSSDVASARRLVAEVDADDEDADDDETTRRASSRTVRRIISNVGGHVASRASSSPVIVRHRHRRRVDEFLSTSSTLIRLNPRLEERPLLLMV